MYSAILRKTPVLFFLLLAPFLDATIDKKSPPEAAQEKTLYLFSDFYPNMEVLNQYLAPFHKKIIFKDRSSVPKKPLDLNALPIALPSLFLFTLKKSPSV